MTLPAAAAALLYEARELARRGRLADAIGGYERALEIAPGHADGWYSLALLQRRARRFDAALDSYRLALAAGAARPEEIHLNRGVIYADDLRRSPAARLELEAALALNPAYLPALLNLANLEEDLGQRSAAADLYERVLELEPDHALALARRAGVHAFADPADPWIERLRRALQAPGTSAAERADLGFALGRALDACGQYAQAFGAYSAANRASRDGAPAGVPRYDRRAHERLIDRLIAAFPATPGAARTEESGAAAQTPRPIFICGMFRSGSTLVEQLLAGHPRLTAGGELDLLPRMADGALAPFPESMPLTSPARIAELAAAYRQALAEIFPAADRVTDKRPDNFLLIGLIKRLFPNAKILHTVRDALDNCLSIFFLHLDQRMGYALDLGDIGHYFRQYRRLMAHWRIAYGADIRDIDYDALVADPEPQMRALLTFLALEWHPDCLDIPPAGRSVRTASVWQVREPLHRRSSGRARHYQTLLAPLREALADP